MARRSDPLCRLVLSHLKHAPGSLDQTSGTPSGDKSARERGIGEVDRDGVIQNPRIPEGVIAQRSEPQFSSSHAVI